MNVHYGYFDIDSTISSVRSQNRRVIGKEPKISKDADLSFIDIKTKRDDGLSKKSIKEVKPSFDNCRDIIREIECIKKEIERYKSIGVQQCYDSNGRETNVINWNKVAINAKRQLETLYELL